MEPKRCYGCMKIKTSSPVCEHCGYDERMTNAPHHLPAGTILWGQYLVGRVLGQGGFGITYLGWDIKLDAPVAIKEYYPNGMVLRDTTRGYDVWIASEKWYPSFEENRERFLREARTLAQLRDVPEVVQVMNFFEENRTAYIIMGYVKGITLKEYLRSRGGKLNAAQTLRLLMPLMDALGKVHALGLVHRDISPDNIMLQPDGQIKLIDFGAAHVATNPYDDPTQAVLKRGYAPLEQYQSTGSLGPWTDVYALCATIYCCLTGTHPPYATDRFAEDKDFRWDLIRDLTPEQRTALRQGVETEHTSRIQSMAELKTRLTATEPPKKSRNPGVFVAGAAVAAALLAAVLFMPEKPVLPESPVSETKPGISVAKPEATYASEAATEHVHSWMAATYDFPKTCTVCGETEGMPLERENPFADLRVGDTVSFGEYEQDDNTANGKEPIVWEVIDREEDSLLLMSRYALDCRQYHTSDSKVTWETSALREWLNGTFLNTAFSGEEQSYFLYTTVPADVNPEHKKVNPGADTKDMVYLLSVQEALDYFPDYRDRACEATAYTKAQGLRVCWWWLRTPGESQRTAVSINSNGSWDEDGSDVAGTQGGVRPVLWVTAGGR